VITKWGDGAPAGARRWAAVAAGLALVAVVAGCSAGDDGDASGASPGMASGRTSDTTAPDGDPGSWPTAGLDLANSRAALGSRLTTETIDGVDELWRTPLPEAAGLSTAPLVVDGTVYAQGASGQVVAVDLATGDLTWTSEPTGYNIGPYGVAVDGERVYALDGSQGVLALDRADGAVVWRTDVTTTPTLGIDIQPVVVDGLVLASSVPVSIGGIYTPGDRGVIHALDAATGAVRWTFDTVEGDLWGHPEVNSGGGAWYPPAVDEDRGLVYFGVANPAPFPGTAEWPNGTSRPGPNLYTNSVVALDLASGELRWYHQVTPHDLLDRDQVHVLLAEVDGEDLVVSAGKSGVLVGLDPEDGTPRWRREVGLHRNDDLEALDGPTEVAPGTYGGILTPPSTADGVVYAAVLNAPATLAPDETAYFGATLGQADGEVVAVGAADGELLWSTPVPGDPLGGTAVVGDLVVTTLMQGSIVALDRDGGEIVWTADLGGGTNGWLAALDDMLIVPVGNADPPSLLALGLPGA
jgi:outer membrane protein assembly factor BamB